MVLMMMPADNVEITMVAVMVVAVCILAVLMVWVVPRFQDIFKDMIPGEKMPAFTVLVLSISNAIAKHFPVTVAVLALIVTSIVLFIKTNTGRHLFDKFKLVMPVLGPVISKVAISRFCRTLGTLISSGVPILQALTIVKETSGNVVVGDAVNAVHESVKEGETITARSKPRTSFRPWSSRWWTSVSRRARSRKC